MLGKVTLQFDPTVTVDVRKKYQQKLKDDPTMEATFSESVEVLRNHLMRVSIRDGEFTIFSDEPTFVGGEGWAPSMFDYFFAGALLCECAQYIWNAADLGILGSINKLQMNIKGAFRLAGWAGHKNVSPALKDVVVTAKIEGDAAAKDIEQLAKLAAERCPAHQSLIRAIRIKNVVELNGEKVAEFANE